MTQTAARVGPAAGTLRERQRDLTRIAIAEAAARVVLDVGLHEFSMQQVADEAGVSLRTLYRYYASREELLTGIGEEVDRAMGLRLPRDDELRTPAELVEAVTRAMREFLVRPDLGRAWVAINVGTGVRSESMRRHDDLVRQALARLAPHLTALELERVVAVVRHLGGSLATKVLTDDLGMDKEEAITALGWGMRTLLESIAAGGRPE